MADSVSTAKTEGNALFKKGDYAGAEQKYTSALDELKAQGADATAAPLSELDDFRAKLLSNRSACRLKVGDAALEAGDDKSGRELVTSALEDCSEGLRLRGASRKIRIKLLFRRAQAMVKLGAPAEQVSTSLRKLLALDSSNAAAKALLRTAEAPSYGVERALGVVLRADGEAAAAAALRSCAESEAGARALLSSGAHEKLLGMLLGSRAVSVF